VKGLTSLLLLQQIFIALENEVGHAVVPYQYFDLIGGTSTGGCVSSHTVYLLLTAHPPSRRLIAIMLGRLHMTVDEAINMYKTFSPTIFKKKWWTQNQPMKYFGAELQQYWFEGKNLKAAVQDMLKARDLDENLKFLESDDPTCRV
jgi:patatin-like phospholipase/acyl hydrolase